MLKWVDHSIANPKLSLFKYRVSGEVPWERSRSDEYFVGLPSDVSNQYCLRNSKEDSFGGFQES